MNNNTKEPEPYPNTVPCFLEICLPKIHQVPYTEPKVTPLEMAEAGVSPTLQLATTNPSKATLDQTEEKRKKTNPKPSQELLLAKLSCLQGQQITTFYELNDIRVKLQGFKPIESKGKHQHLGAHLHQGSTDDVSSILQSRQTDILKSQLSAQTGQPLTDVDQHSAQHGPALHVTSSYTMQILLCITAPLSNYHLCCHTGEFESRPQQKHRASYKINYKRNVTSKGEEPTQNQGQKQQIQPYFMLPDPQPSLPGIKAILFAPVPSLPLAVGPDCLIDPSCFDLSS